MPLSFSGWKRVPRPAWLLAGALGAAGIAAACSSSATSNENLVSLSYVNTTVNDTLRVQVKVGGAALGTYNLKAAGPPDTYTAIGVAIKTGTVVTTTVIGTSGIPISTGICTTSDAPTLGYARILITPAVSCDCGFAEHGGAACGP